MIFLLAYQSIMTDFQNSFTDKFWKNGTKSYLS